MPLRTNGAALRRLRELAGMTATEFAHRTGYTLQHVSQVELGNANGGPSYQRAAADLLGCTIADITTPDAPPEAPTHAAGHTAPRTA